MFFKLAAIQAGEPVDISQSPKERSHDLHGPAELMDDFYVIAQWVFWISQHYPSKNYKFLFDRICLF